MSTLPESFLNEIRALLGDEFDAFLAVQGDPHVTSLRLNPFRENAEALAAPPLSAAPRPDGAIVPSGMRVIPVRTARSGFTLPLRALPPCFLCSALLA